MKKLLFSIILVLLLPVLSLAAVRTVGPAKDHATIQACSDVAVAGDSCVVYAGTYAGWTQATNGGSGSPITFKANAGDSVTINSKITLNNRSYITLGGSGATEGFTITGQIALTNNNNVIIQRNAVTNSSVACIDSAADPANPSTYMYFLNNTFGPCNSGVSPLFDTDFNANYVLWDGNTVTRTANGPVVYGSYIVLRGNHFGPVTAQEGDPEHPDATEHTCNSTLTLEHMVYENNVTQEWRGDNAHGFLLRNTVNSGTCTAPTNSFNVIRNSKFMNIGSYFAVIQTNMPGVYIYNNSISHVEEDIPGKGRVDLAFQANSDYGKVINNIIANTTNTNNPWCIYVDADSTTGFVEHDNLCYIDGYSGAYQEVYSGQSLDATDILNSNPLFVNATSNLTLQAESPAIDAGGALTTVAAADTGSGTSLVVTDAGFFQNGFGLTGVQADWIAIGTVGNVVQISSINYATNTITLANTISRSDGDSIWLYKKSDGIQVLYGTAPDIGAYEYTPDSTAPTVAITTADPSTIAVDSLAIVGTATDLVGVTSCKWRLGAAPNAENGTALTGTTSWSGTATGFAEGANTLYAGCTDAAGNWGSDSMTVTYTPAPPATGFSLIIGVTGGVVGTQQTGGMVVP